MVPPGRDPYTGGLSAQVFQRLAFSPGNPAGSHPVDHAENSDSISAAYATTPLAKVDSAENPGNPCVDASRCARKILTFGTCDRVRSCVRPHRAAFHMPRAGMEMRGSGPNHSRRALDVAVDSPGFPDPDLFDHLPMQVFAFLTPHTPGLSPERGVLRGQAISGPL